MKTIILSFFLILSLYSHAARKPEIVHYSEAVDVFEITDNLSQWHEGSVSAYRDAWEKEFGLDGTDHNFLERYKKLRTRYKAKLPKDYDKPTLFSNPDIPLDFFSNAFYTSESVGRALIKLKKKLEPDEVSFLSEFYKHFKPKLSTLVKESTFFIDKSVEFDKALKKGKGSSLIKRVARFFNRKRQQAKVKAFLVWWPKDKDPKISVVGQNILFRYHPIEHASKIVPGDFVEGAVLAFTASMTTNQKINLSKQFTSTCVLEGPIKKTDIFEKPLAVAIGRILLSAEYDKKKFDLYKNWTIHPWGNVFSKMLYPLVTKGVKKRKATIGTGNFVLKAATACHELVVLKDFFGAFKTAKD